MTSVFVRSSRAAAGTVAAAALLVFPRAARAQLAVDTANDAAITTLVSKLDLEKYKATIKGLTKFGDRRQGTKRNRDATDWIEAQLKSYGCSDVTRLVYDFTPPAPMAGRTPPPPSLGLRMPESGQGGSKLRGRKTAIGVNTDSLQQPDAKIRSVDAEATTPGKREEVYCTKVGSVHPDEMYIVGGHMDGHGWNEAANDDGSGTAIVMELARIMSDPSVKTDRSIRFAIWNNEETGLNGARAYVQQRQGLQGKEEPLGSGKYPEPKWLGMIQHDMMLWDHGMPLADGTLPKEQRPEADVNVEFQLNSKMWLESSKLAWGFALANERFATDYPVAVGPHMTNTDSGPFQDLIPSISLRENERGREIGAGWDPNWHQPTDVFATYSDKDFRLGLNAAQTTLGAVARFVGTTVK